MDAPDLLLLNDPVTVVPYDPAWPEQFRLERARILEAVFPFTGPMFVEHVGSTSVPGLSAKPVIDIVISAEGFPLSDEAIRSLGALGYDYRGEAGIPGREYFRTNPRGRHLHVVGLGSEFFVSQLLFRGFLRSHPEAARRYENLKYQLAERFRHAREAYTDAKGPLIEELLLEARS